MGMSRGEEMGYFVGSNPIARFLCGRSPVVGHSLFRLFPRLFDDMVRGGAVWQLTRLITLRSWVQIPVPLLPHGEEMGYFDLKSNAREGVTPFRSFLRLF